MHIAACQLLINGQPRPASAEVPEFVTWTPDVQRRLLRTGEIVFVPPQIIPPAVAPAVVPEARTEAPQKRGRR